ncbi:MAG: putative metal-binding motif-containing protein [Nevskiales bacterium]
MGTSNRRFALSLLIGLVLPGGAAWAVVCEHDAECSDNLFCNGQERCEPRGANSDARGCVSAQRASFGGSPQERVPCASGKVCDEASDRCLTPGCETTAQTDQDGDGVDGEHCGGTDCDDGNPRRYPGANEVCGDNPALDEDCDPSTWGSKPGPGNDRDRIDCQPGRGARQSGFRQVNRLKTDNRLQKKDPDIIKKKY